MMKFILKRRILGGIMLMITLVFAISSCAKGNGDSAGTTATTAKSTTAVTTKALTTTGDTTKSEQTTKAQETTKAPVTTTAQTTQPAPAGDISKYLITHWDFSGTSLTQRLSDKASAGNSKDDLTLMGNVTVKDGKATVYSDAGAYLYAKNQSDINSYTEFTYFIKFKATGTAVGFADFISKSGKDLFRAFINDTKSIDSKDFIDCRYKSNIGTSWAFQNPQTFNANQDFYIALTARLDKSEQKVYLVSYKSFDGVIYEMGSEKAYGETDAVIGMTTDFNADPTLGALIIGKHYGNSAKDMGITFEFDDIRIYNRALTQAEIASIKVS